MNLLSALDNFLHKCYGAFVDTEGEGTAISSNAFYKSVILRAVEDDGFRGKLLADPRAVLREEGIALPEQMKITFVENTKDTIHIVIPPFVGE